MAIDPETKASIEEMLKMSSKRRTHTSTPPIWERPSETAEERETRKRYDAELRERYAREEAIRAEESTKMAAEESKRRRERMKDFFGSTTTEDDPGVNVEAAESCYDMAVSANLRDEVAALSINAAKACIVFRSVVTEQFLKELYQRIDAKYRTFNTRDRVFEFHPSVLPKLKQLLASFYKDIQLVGVPKAIPATKFDKLMQKLDKEDRNKIYRLLASKYHPDVKPTGNNETMTLINDVFKGV